VYGRHLQVYLRRKVIALCIDHDRQAADQLAEFFLLPSNGHRGASAQEVETDLEQFFASKQVSPTDQAQLAMGLNWGGR